MITSRILVIVVLLITSPFVFAQQAVTYMIPYAKGMDTLIQNPGDTIGGETIFFDEDIDHFARKEPMDGVVEFSSHGYVFWGYETTLQVREDTLTGSIFLYSLVLAPPPSSLVEIALIGGDDNDLGDLPTGLGFILLMISILFTFIAFLLTLWLKTK